MDKYNIGDRVIHLETQQEFFILDVLKDERSLLQQAITYKLVGPHPTLDTTVSQRELDMLFRLVLNPNKENYDIAIKELEVQSTDNSFFATSRTCLLAASSLRITKRISHILDQLEYLNEQPGAVPDERRVSNAIALLRELIPEVQMKTINKES